mmetsp:Transcript_5161/g.7633  ORF Transcript_5161/g.7633 Transcript_5161/m.7633 type:complete len:207 (-) Transcript_5161:958-1578(-)
MGSITEPRLLLKLLLKLPFILPFILPLILPCILPLMLPFMLAFILAFILPFMPFLPKPGFKFILFRLSAGPPFKCENADTGWMIELPCFSCVNDVIRPSGALLLTKVVGGDFNVMLVRTLVVTARCPCCIITRIFSASSLKACLVLSNAFFSPISNQQSPSFFLRNRPGGFRAPICFKINLAKRGFSALGVTTYSFFKCLTSDRKY